MDWKSYIFSCLIAFGSIICIECLQEFPVDIDLIYPEEPEVSTTTSDLEQELIEIIGNASQIEEYPQFEKFSSSDTFLKNCKCGVQGEPDPFPFRTRTDIQVGIDDNEGGVPIEPFIVGGQITGEYEFPWMVALAKTRYYDPPGSVPRVTCGATIINSRFLVTAAHCIKNESPSRYHILIKAHNLTQVFGESSSVLITKAKRFIPHPRWNVKTVANDIGLIELETPIDFANEPNIRPACLPTPSDGDFAGLEAVAVGFGYTQQKGAMATVLRKVSVPVISHNECIKTRYSTMVTKTMLCAGYDEGGKDACTNDSGGPLTLKSSEGYHKLVGVVSWGHGCAMPNAPGVYTRVTKYLNWIRSIVKGSEWCKPV